MDEQEIRSIAKSIVSQAKAGARVDQGTLKRSIAYTYVKGMVIFRQIFYGNYNDNSILEELANKNMPFGVSYKVVLTELGGEEYESGKTKQGRTSQRKALNAVKNTTTNIRKLIAMVQKRKEQDGEKED